MRLTPSMVAGYDTYGFRPDGSFPELVNGILAGDYPGNEFYMAGNLVKQAMPEETQSELRVKGVHLFRMANQGLNALAVDLTGGGFVED